MLHNPSGGKRQDVWTKKWVDPKEGESRLKRKEFSTSDREGGIIEKDGYKVKEAERSHKGIIKQTQIDRKVIFSNEYEKKFNMLGESKTTTRSICSEARRMLNHRNGTKFEDLAFINTKTGKILRSTEYNVESSAKPTNKMVEMLKDTSSIIAIHNHPESTLPSAFDLQACAKRGYKYGIIICHDGKVYKYSINKNLSEQEFLSYEHRTGMYYGNEYSFSDLRDSIYSDLGALIEEV
ncbi:MAG: hypothetical protein RR626_02575 [Anaerovoracaceae bacterium]